MNDFVKIGGKRVGKSYPVFIVVEIGVCHEQNIEVALGFVDKAKDAGADAIKVQAFQADDFVLDRSLSHTYGTTNGQVTENYYDLLKRLELNFDQIKRIKERADELGILFFSTVHDKEDRVYY